METSLKKILACLVMSCFIVTSVANAAAYNSFTFTPSTTAAFTASKITGNYIEVATFNADSTFDVSLFWDAGQFVANGGATPLTAHATGLGNNYQLYALYKAHGTTINTGGSTTFTFSKGSGSLKMYVDNQFDTNFSVYTTPTTGTGSFAFSGSSNDILIEDGMPLTGVGTLNTGLSTCGSAAGINCGSFGSTTQFVLTNIGKNYFSNPSNLTTFYDVSFQSGQLNGFSPTGTQTIDGSLDVTFSYTVPEPGTTILFGLGLLGASLVRRRQQP